MIHDTGNAPEIKDNVCILQKCRRRDIVKYSEIGDWIIGIGGKYLGHSKGNSGLYDRKLIYAMRVEKNKGYPQSSEFYFFGENAIEIPEELSMLCPQFNRFRLKYFDDLDIISRFESFIRSHKIGSNGVNCDSMTCDDICSESDEDNIC